MKKGTKKISKFSKVFDIHYFLHDFIRFTGVIPTLIYLRTKKHFVNKTKGYFKGNFIVVANHSTYIDPIIIMASIARRRFAYIVSKDVYKNKFLNWLLPKVKCIKIDKENVSFSVFSEVTDVFNHGHCVAMFPEGHLDLTGNINSFKAGAALFAATNGADIVPMYIAKRKNIWKRQHVMFGKRINVKDYISGKMATMDELNTITSELCEQEKLMKEYFDKGETK